MPGAGATRPPTLPTRQTCPMGTIARRLSDRHVVVVGAGVTGLTTAHTLLAEPDAPRVTVLEAADRTGGKIRTSSFAGLDAVDEAADAYLIRVPWVVDLVRELGLGDELTNPATGSAAVWHGRMHPIPAGLVLGVPSDLASLARSRLLSWRGKARAAMEPLLPRTDPGDCIGHWVRSRFGGEVHERLIDPLVGSIYASDTDRSSLAAVPQLAALAGPRSALLAARKMRPRGAGPAGPVFEAPLRGMGALTDALAQSIRQRGGSINTGARVEHIERVGRAAGSGSGAGGYCVAAAGVALDEADAVVVTSPAGPSAPLLAPLSGDAAALLGGVDHAGVVMVTATVPAESWPEALAYSGYLVPKPDQRSVTAVSFASNKWPHWRPADGSMLLRISLGRDGLNVDDWDDERIVDAAVSEVGGHLGLDLQPGAVRVSRWPGAFPQYRPGHFERVDSLERALAADAPGVLVAGASHRGIGIPTCVQQGRRAAGLVGELLVTARQ